MMYPLIRSLLFHLDPEEAHDYAVRTMASLQQVPIALHAISRFTAAPQSLAKTVWGLRFASPVGIAAGFDKNAELMPMLAALGFGFIEVGTVTLRPQPGNPRPRMFRYPEVRGLINRMGFNNDGAEAVAAHIARWRASADAQPPLFVNVGKNREVPLEAAGEAYAECYRVAARDADVAVMNLSSPNTPSLRELQRPEHLERLLGDVRSVRYGTKPLLVKIAPDVDSQMLREIAEVCVKLADGMICTNTTVDRLPGMTEAGGLSGAPLRKKSTDVLAAVRRIVGDAFPLIGVGGVFDADDANEKLAAGADLVQVYTGFIYEGPLMARRISRGLAGQ